MLTLHTLTIIARLFPAEDQSQVRKLLQTQCGNNLPLCQHWSVEQLERLQLAALKCSGGDWPRLRQAVKMAQQDWRDLLLVAGFAQDPQAHKSWLPARVDFSHS